MNHIIPSLCPRLVLTMWSWFDSRFFQSYHSWIESKYLDSYHLPSQVLWFVLLSRIIVLWFISIFIRVSLIWFKRVINCINLHRSRSINLHISKSNHNIIFCLKYCTYISPLPIDSYTHTTSELLNQLEVTFKSLQTSLSTCSSN